MQKYFPHTHCPDLQKRWLLAIYELNQVEYSGLLKIEAFLRNWICNASPNHPDFEPMWNNLKETLWCMDAIIVNNIEIINQMETLKQALAA